MMVRRNPRPPGLIEYVYGVEDNDGSNPAAYLSWSEPDNPPNMHRSWEFNWNPDEKPSPLAAFEPQVVTYTPRGVSIRQDTSAGEIWFPWQPGEDPQLSDQDLRTVGMGNYFVLRQMAQRFTELFPNARAVRRLVVAERRRMSRY
jgi:hypothetical protein